MAVREASQQAFYRRGVILGLSLAEALIILIFVLLIFFTLILVGHEQQTEESRLRQEDLKRQIAAAQLIIARFAPHATADAVEVDHTVQLLEIFRELLAQRYTEDQLRNILLSVTAYGSSQETPNELNDFRRAAWAHAAVLALEKSGVNVADVVADPRGVRALQSLVGKGYSRAQILRYVEAIEDFGAPADLPNDWKKFALAAQRNAKLEADGVNLQVVADNPALLTVIQQLLGTGYSVEQLRNLLAAVPQFGSPAELRKDWSRVAWAAQTLEWLEREGVNARILAQNPALLVALQRLLEVGYTSDHLREFLAALPQFGRPGNLPRDWSRVVSTFRAVASLENAGVDVRALVADPRPFVALQQLIERGYTREELRDLLNAVSLFGDPGKLPKEWSRVALAATTLDQLEKRGVDVKTLTQNSSILVTAQQLLGRGYTREQLRDLLAAAPLFGPSSALPKDWAQVVRDLALVRTLRDGSVSVEDLAKNPSLVKELQNALQAGRTPEHLKAGFKNAQGPGGPMPGPGGPIPEPRGTWPPMIPLSEADGYYFPTDSAKLSPAFKAKLRDHVVRRILDVMNDYKVDVVEVIGNTDERPIKRRQSNMDRSLLPVLRGGAAPESMLASDNAGLGLARAVAVTQELRRDRRLADRMIIPLSASYLVDSSGRLTQGDDAGDVEKRRRIEIRLRKAN